ncbi:hypothetical protein BD408DRAFT_437547 [Parasitella parasitica]|nr:hypothetical protein BD408DRAFT_437547 [Parasitella parasitica]
MTSNGQDKPHSILTSFNDNEDDKKMNATFKRLISQKSIDDGLNQQLRSIDYVHSDVYVAQLLGFVDFNRELAQKYISMLRTPAEDSNYSKEEAVRLKYHIDVLYLQRQVIKNIIREHKFIALLDGKETQIKMATREIRALHATLKTYKDLDAKCVRKYNITVSDLNMESQFSGIAKKQGEERLKTQKHRSRINRQSASSGENSSVKFSYLTPLKKDDSSFPPPNQESDLSSPVRGKRNQDLFEQVYSLCSPNEKLGLSSPPGKDSEVQELNNGLSNLHVLDSASSMQDQRNNTKDLLKGKQSEYIPCSSIINAFPQWNKPNPNDMLARSTDPRTRNFNTFSSANQQQSLENKQKHKSDPNIKNMTLKPFMVPSSRNRETFNISRLEAGFSPSPPMPPVFTLSTNENESRNRLRVLNPEENRILIDKLQAKATYQNTSMRRRMGLSPPETITQNTTTLMQNISGDTTLNKEPESNSH